MKRLLLLLPLVAGCTAKSPVTGEASSPVVYGTDDRLDYYEHPSALFRDITRQSIVALIDQDQVDERDPANIRISGDTLGDQIGLCQGERFADNITAASCSGTLIDNDLVLTAGHCVSSLTACRGLRFVFNYFYESAGQLSRITADDVYRCRQIVARQSRNGPDYGVIQLDRPVAAPHRPAHVRAGDVPLVAGSTVAVIGFGSGVPAKIDLGGRVLDPRAGTLDYFTASTDTFGGNSGSGVFDAQGDVVGILVTGETDYVRVGSCTRVNVIPPNGDGGEGVTYVARAVEAMCGVWKSDVCGDTGGWCRSCASASQCPMGWSCDAEAGDRGVTWCAKPCGADGDCDPGHLCGSSGRCSPASGMLACSDGDVWSTNSCGRIARIQTDCSPDQICENAACGDGAPGNGCHNPITIPAESQTLTGDLGATFGAGYEGSCGAAGRDRVYRMELDRRVRLTAQATGFDTVLYVRNVCEDSGTEEACNDDSDPPGRRGSRIEVELDPGEHFLFVDSFNTGGFGGRLRTFNLVLQLEDLEEPPPPDAGVMPEPPDAGFAPDAVAASPDAGFAEDSGAVKDLEPAESGCGCSAASPARGGGSIAALALAGLLSARRRRRRGA